MAKKQKSGAGNSARTARGKPFEKGNPYAFKPGQSGNTSGRPRDTITPHLREIVQQQYPGKDEITYGRLIAQKLADQAVAGEISAIRECFDRLEGKPRQSLDVHTNSDDWVEAVKAQGLNIDDVVAEALLLIERATEQRDQQGAGEEAPG